MNNEATITAQIGSGRTVHIATYFGNSTEAVVICGASQNMNGRKSIVTETTGEVTCKRCLGKQAAPTARPAATEAPAPAEKLELVKGAKVISKVYGAGVIVKVKTATLASVQFEDGTKHTCHATGLTAA